MILGRARPTRVGLLLSAILLLALAFRLHGIGFGLPALYDPDEPLFVVSALKLLKDQTLNPGWFGHPGTTTIYTLALIDLLVLGAGWLGGWWSDAQGFAAAIYADPSVVVLPGRLFVALCGVGCVWLTFLVGRRLFDARAGLLAAALLAVNPLHIEWSQVIRTDVHATLFMLLAALGAIGIARHGRPVDYLLTGVCIGLGTATKWPAATMLVCLAGAALLRMRDHPDERRRIIACLFSGLAASLAALIIASPYLLLDYPTVLANLGREGRPMHLGSTGGGLFDNLGWYVSGPIRASAGLAGAVLAGVGLLLVIWRSRVARFVIIPGFLAFLLAIAGESLVWARWIVPLLPFLSLFIAVAVGALVSLASRNVPRAQAPVLALLLAAIALPMVATARAQATERLHDTRGLASQWARQHIPRTDRIVLEHLAFDMLDNGWPFLFPAGAAGCIDGNKMLAGKVSYADVERWRQGRSIVDLGTIDRSQIARCWGDYAIISHADRYLRESAHYPGEIANYRAFFDNATVMQTFKPRRGEVGGPDVYILKLKPISPSRK